MRRASIFLFAALSAGCAREARPRVADAPPPPPPTCPVVWHGGAPVFSEPAPVMPVFDNTLGAPAPPPLVAGITSAPAPASTTPWQPVTFASRDIPAGERCLAMLDATGTSYKKLGAKNGIETPIEVTSDIGGVRYEPGAGQSLLCDCRFAVALHRVAPILKSAGVSRVRFSGAYSYRMSRVGRLSLHAYGLAMDVHELTVNGTTLAVRRDFTRGLANGCASDAPALNQVACRLKSAGMFRELLTPDFNADHADHFHLGVEPLTNSPIGTRIAVKPKKKLEKPEAKPAKVAEKHETPASEPVFVADDDEEPALDELDAALDEPELVFDEKPAKKTKRPRNAPRAEKRDKDDGAAKAEASEKPKQKSKKRDKHASQPDARASEERDLDKPQKKPSEAPAKKKRKPRRSARTHGTGST